MLLLAACFSHKYSTKRRRGCGLLTMQPHHAGGWGWFVLRGWGTSAAASHAQTEKATAAAEAAAAAAAAAAAPAAAVGTLMERRRGVRIAPLAIPCYQPPRALSPPAAVAVYRSIPERRRVLRRTCSAADAPPS